MKGISWSKALSTALLLLAAISQWLAPLAVLAGTAQISGSASVAAEPGEPPAHKLQISDPTLAGEVIANGGRLVADYGGYQLYEIAQMPARLLRQTPQLEFRDEYNLVLLNATRLDTTKAESKALRQPLGVFSGKRLHLVQFAGPLQPAWHEGLTNTGVQIVAYVPHNAYLVYGDGASLGRLQAKAASATHIQWEAPYLDAYKIHPAAQALALRSVPSGLGAEPFTIQMLADPAANKQTLALLERLAPEPFARPHRVLQYLNAVVRLLPNDLALVAGQPEVVSIQPYFAPRKLCERQDQIVAGNLTGNVPSGAGYLAWLESKGFTQAQFTASGFVVDVSDSGIDNGTTSPNHFGLHLGGVLSNASRVVYSRLEGTPNSPSTLAGCDGHGTLNAHIIGGFVDRAGFPHTDSQGFHFGLGVCPFALLGASVIFDSDNFTSPNLNNLQSEAYDSGARISNNSWGSGFNGAYDVTAQTFDALVRDAQPDGSTHPTPGNQQMVIVFAAGNDGPTPQTVGPPGTAKNVISAGACENVQAFGGPDASGITDSDADSANDVASFSGRGPCADGRHKPDLMAPGSHVSGGVAQAPNPGPNGTADPCYNGNGVSGGTNSDIFFPLGQQFYTASSGTSHSAPCISGGCALLRQYFINNFTNPPSPAMTKAFLVNSARYLTGAAAHDNLWSDNQGMGGLDLGMAFDGTSRILRDEVVDDLFTASGQVRTFMGAVADTNKAVRVTVAWTDAPGATFGAAYNNNLDLIVLAGGQTYHGNVFSGAYSVPGGSADLMNNVESVFLPPGTSGNFIVKVAATDINSDGVPNNDFPLDQDFALVIYNVTPTSAPVINGAGSSLTAESCSPGNGAIDPGETVSLAFALQNVGIADTTHLVATLLPAGGVLAPSSPQNYGILVAGGPPATHVFSFTSQGACGGIITPTFQLQDGPANLGVVTFNLALGVASALTPLNQNFDSVAAPALPAGWTTTSVDGGSTWSGAGWTSASPPNSAYCPDSANPGLGELLSPVFAISSASAMLTFDNNYDLEADPSSPIGYDGGVLEVKIGNVPFTDVIAAGGTFTMGGYNLTLDNSLPDNPLAGRRAWSGSSGGFISTGVNLPPGAAGQNIQLKWRLGTDNGNLNGGSAWYIDNVLVQDTSYSCCVVSAPPTISGISVTRTNVSVSLNSVTGRNYLLQYKDSLAASEWSPLPPPVAGTGGSISIVDSRPAAAQRFYRVQAN